MHAIIAANRGEMAVAAPFPAEERTTMWLTGRQRHYLRGLAHHRNAMVTVGACGLTGAVVDEIEKALTHHELIKVKLATADRVARRASLEQICERTGALYVQTIGRIGVLYRRAKRPNIKLPDT